MIELLKKMRFSYKSQYITQGYNFPFVLEQAFEITQKYYKNNNGNLCLIFPSKSYIAHWLSLPSVFKTIKHDYDIFRSNTEEQINLYKKNDILLLNNRAIVKWIGKTNDGLYKFKVKPDKNGIDEIAFNLNSINDLQPAPNNKAKLSPVNLVMIARGYNIPPPIDKLLNINSKGNRQFYRKVCYLVSKIKLFNEFNEGVLVNDYTISEYFTYSMINDCQEDINKCLVISNNLTDISVEISNIPKENISLVIIDGIEKIHDRATDFIDIVNKGIPILLITDLSEIENFGFISDFEFDYYNFSGEYASVLQDNDSPFQELNIKFDKYNKCKINKILCNNNIIEEIVNNTHLIDSGEDNVGLINIKVELIRLINGISKIIYTLTEDNYNMINNKINKIFDIYQNNKYWLGSSADIIYETICKLRIIIEELRNNKSEKCKRFEELLINNEYDYILCQSVEHKEQITKYLTGLNNINIPKVITSSDIFNIKFTKKTKVILTGWLKYRNMNNILYSFNFDEITLLLYDFENNYFNSLQKINKHKMILVSSTIEYFDNKNISENDNNFTKLVDYVEDDNNEQEDTFDISEFELKIDNARYNKYISDGSYFDTISAKRVNFINDFILYASESHKFLVINELFEDAPSPKIINKKVDDIKPGDIIAFINTERDVLVELIERNTNQENLSEIKKWTEIWRELLLKKFEELNRNFNELITELRKNGCIRHKATIKTWLQDEMRIGPQNDDDLKCIAKMSNSELLLNNISLVRESIGKMIGLRMKAANYISEIIKQKLHQLIDENLINKEIILEGLGRIVILQVSEISNTWDIIDYKHVNKLLSEEME